MGNLNCYRILEDPSTFRESSVIQLIQNRFSVKGTFNFQKQSTFRKIDIAASQFCSSTGIGVQYIQLVTRLLAYRHDNIFNAFCQLPKAKRSQFFDDLSYIDIELMDALYNHLVIKQQNNKELEMLLSRNKIKAAKYLDSQKIKRQQKIQLNKIGTKLLRQGQVAIVFMCAGSSSRYFFQDKFLTSLNLQNDQSQQLLAILFHQLRLNFKLLTKSQKISIPIYIMVNQNNYSTVQKYLQTHDFFNFDQKKVKICCLPSLPVLNNQGKFCMNFQYKLIQRPAGSAYCVEEILNTQTYCSLKSLGVKYVHFVGTQNLAQNPGDPLLIGITCKLQRQISIKCTNTSQSRQNFKRLITTRQKVLILDIQEWDFGQHFSILDDSKIALNSILFQLDSLNDLVKDFNNNIFISKNFRVKLANQNVYDFYSKKPVINQQSYVFQKDITDILSCTKKPLLLKVNRRQFIPIVSKSGEYSVGSAINQYKQLKGIIRQQIRQKTIQNQRITE